MPIFLLAVPRNILKCRFLYSTQSLNFNNDAILLGIILCVFRQVYLVVVMPDQTKHLCFCDHRLKIGGLNKHRSSFGVSYNVWCSFSTGIMGIATLAG